MFTEMGIPTKALIARKTSLPENAPAPCIPHDIME
jgi:tRNA (guanine-N7-)-methyltransferase